MEELLKTVVEGGFCIGCGSCASVSGSPLRMTMDGQGRMTPRLAEERAAQWEADLLNVCPFSDAALDETRIAALRFPDAPGMDEAVGRFVGIFAGHVREGRYRENGSSGGMGSWLGAELLKRGHVDGVVHVGRGDEEQGGELFQYSVSRTVEELFSRSKSRYYPVEISQVVQEIREKPGVYALVGVPCVIKAVALLAGHDTELGSRIPIRIGLVCGHLKSARYADMLAWQTGIPPGRLGYINFRAGIPDRSANDYAVEVQGRDAAGNVLRSVTPAEGLFGTDWGLGFFKYKACDYCDDVFAETADVTIGDAWLRPYVLDGGGTNLVVTRNPLIHEILTEGADEGRIQLEALTPHEAAASQAGGLRHRREGLACRLERKDAEGTWRPKKRVSPSAKNVSARERSKYLLRESMSETSHVAYDAALLGGDFRIFRKRLAPLVARYRRLQHPPVRRILLFGKDVLKRVLRAVGLR